MINLTTKLEEREKQGKPIHTGIVGAGQMGKGLTSQMNRMVGMQPSVVVSRNIDHAVEAYKRAGYEEGVDFATAETLEEANELLDKGIFVATSNTEIATNADIIDCVIEATGVPEVGSKVAVDSINAGKDIVMLNVETDVCVGHILKKLADEKGVIYTGSAGDEPGAVIEMYDYAKALGFDVKVIGKGKNNEPDLTSTPEKVADYAHSIGASPKMICSFVDGTKTMVEMTAMANATGFKPDVVGAHGPVANLDNLTRILSTKEEGGILNNYGVVEYIQGLAPGVFIIVSSDQADVTGILDYLKMGPGPNYTLFRPYHLTSLETPMTVVKAVMDREPTIIPKEGRVAETVAVTKKDLKKGDHFDEIGGYTFRGTFMEAQEADRLNAVPVGLINNNTVITRDIGEGEIITYDDVELDEDSFIVNLRKKQDEWLGISH